MDEKFDLDQAVVEGFRAPRAARPLEFAAPTITDEDIDAVVGVLRSGWLTSGRQVQALEEELCDYLEVPHVVAVSSGTAALEIALAFLALPPGSRVGVPTWTHVASVLASVHLDATPVLLDVDADSLNLSPTSLEAALADGLDAVVAVHFGGVPVDPAIHELSAAARVPVIEDAAHAFAANDQRGPISGRGSVAAAFSFYATKNLTAGEGGAIATHDSAVADYARVYRLHGLTPDRGEHAYDCVLPGSKANLPDVLAALARSQLKRIHESQARRRWLTERYRDRLESVPDLRIIPSNRVPGSSDHLMVVLVPYGVRPAVVAELARAGVPTSIHFRPLHHLQWFRGDAELGVGGLPVADQLASRALSLPLHTGMSSDDVHWVCDVLVESLRGK